MQKQILLATMKLKPGNSKDEAWTKAGSEKSLNYIVGQEMKKTRGKASPGEVHNLVRAQVDKL